MAKKIARLPLCADGDGKASGRLARAVKMFTYFLLKGLNGKAQDTGGRITSQSLYRYLKPMVQDEARRQNREQTPQFRGGDADLRLR